MPRESRAVYPVRAKPKRAVPRSTLVFGVALAGILLLTSGLWYLANLAVLRVQAIEVLGTRKLSAQEVERTVREALVGRVLVVLPRDNFFIASSESLEHLLRERFAAVREVDVLKHFPHRLSVRIAERELWGVYCVRKNSVPPGPCAYLDTSGTTYDEFAYIEGWLLPVIYGSESLRLGSGTVPPATLEFFNQAERGLEAIGQNLLAISMSTSTPADARLRLAEGWSLLVTSTRPVEEWLGVLRALLDREIGSRRAELDYVDLRFGSKVFYKFK